MKSKVSKDSHDISAIFLCYVACCADCERTGLAMDVDPEVVRQIAASEGWVQKLKKVSLLHTSDKSGDYERGTNRALNFIAAHMGRSIIQKILDALARQDGHELLATLSSTKAGQVSVSARFISDLAASLEKFSHISYTALSDSVPEREVKKDEDGELNMQGVHAAVLAALSAPIAAGAERKLLEHTIDETIRTNAVKKPEDE